MSDRLPDLAALEDLFSWPDAGLSSLPPLRRDIKVRFLTCDSQNALIW
jgi:hypothetical protein